MHSIDHLPISEQQHFILCSACSAWVDMRNLADIWEHLHLGKKLQMEWSGSRRKGAKEFYQNRNVCTNPRWHKRVDTAMIRRLNHQLKKFNQ